jgi:hypothetical protein
MEIILIGLVFTVTSVTLSLYPKINKGLMILIIAPFLVLYLINFFVTSTFEGRLLYCSSILLLFPVYKMFRQLNTYGLKYE